MRHGPFRIAVLLALALVASLVSCQQFFTTSLAPFLARDGYTIPATISASEAASLLEQSNGDPVLAAALVAPMYEAASDATPGTPAYEAAAEVLLDAVITSSGVGPVVTDLALLALGSPTEEDIQNASAALLAIDLTATEVGALELLLSQPPESLTPSDAYAAAIALAAVAASQESIDDINSISPEQQADLADNSLFLLALNFIDLAGDLGGDGGFGDMLGAMVEGWGS